MRRISPAATPGRRLNWSGTSSKKSTYRAAIRPWNGKEKAGRHDLLAMPPCDNQITPLWGRTFREGLLYAHIEPTDGARFCPQSSEKTGGGHAADAAQTDTQGFPASSRSSRTMTRVPTGLHIGVGAEIAGVPCPMEGTARIGIRTAVPS